MAERADVPVGTHRAVDEAGVPCPQGVGAEPEVVREPGAEALQEHVGAVDEPQQRLATALVAE